MTHLQRVEYQREYNKSHKEQLREYYDKNKAKINAYSRKYYRRNKWRWEDYNAKQIVKEAREESKCLEN